MKHRSKVKIDTLYVPAVASDISVSIKREKKRLAEEKAKQDAVVLEQKEKVRKLK